MTTVIRRVGKFNLLADSDKVPMKKIHDNASTRVQSVCLNPELFVISTVADTNIFPKTPSIMPNIHNRVFSLLCSSIFTTPRLITDASLNLFHGKNDTCKKSAEKL